MSAEPGSTVKITAPPNTYFHADEEYYVKDLRTNGVVVQRMGINVVLSPLSFEVVDKDWRVLRCPSCSTIMFEIDRTKFTPYSVRLKCRNCKEFTIVRGVRPVKYNQEQIDYLIPALREQIQTGKYKPVESAIMLFAMVKAGRLSEDQVEMIIKGAFEGSELDAISVLARARQVISGELIDKIVEDPV